MMFASLLIANRGEIAVRIARSARRLGIETIAVASDADRGAPHALACDRVVAIGGERAADSYLRGERIVEAAREAGAQAIHPGYGFLAENHDFAEAVLAAGLVWIGPSPAAMRAMADKAAARRRAAALGVPVLAGSEAATADASALRREAVGLGFPLMVKAAAGGGGRGMRLVAAEAGLDAALASAAAESLAAFGDARLLLERAVESARHVEVQVFADAQGHVIHLGERDCSVQRRHQKLIEEAPAPGVSPAWRRRMGEAAVAVARAVDYRGAGTVEFLLAGDGAFWFIEMNTRLQVEHAVTEALLGVDLVEWQIRVAAGDPLPFGQDEALARFESGGHAIEARLCAEDPAEGHLPQAGRLLRWQPPPQVRCDHALASGLQVSAFYDSMLAKLVAHAPTRDEAIAQLALALDRTVCLGLPTNRAFLARVLRDEVFAAGAVDTSFLAARFGAAATPTPSWLEALACTALATLPQEPLPPLWAGWSSQPALERSVRIEIDESPRTWQLAGTAGDVRATCDALAHRIEIVAVDTLDAAGGELDARIDGRLCRAVFARDGEQSAWLADGAELRLVDASRRAAAKAAAAAGSALLAPMHGRITQLRVACGETVEAGQLLVVLEAMKMEHQLRAPRAGIVAALHVRVGEQVAARRCLVELQS